MPAIAPPEMLDLDFLEEEEEVEEVELRALELALEDGCAEVTPFVAETVCTTVTPCWTTAVVM